MQIPTIVDFIQQLVLGFLEGKKCIREFTSAHSEILFVDNNRQERNIVKLLPLAEIITVLLYSVLYLKLYWNAKDSIVYNSSQINFLLYFTIQNLIFR